ncbi:hypothetical protein ACP4OV_029257 [Aristida adscensionis]
MEVFDGASFVRLQSVVRRGEYLAADTDGWGVCVSGQRGTHNTVWAVERTLARDGVACVLLRGAYGLYLSATPHQAVVGLGPSRDTTVRQAPLPDPQAALLDPQAQGPLFPMLQWHAMVRHGSFVLRNVGMGRYLRANGRYCCWRRCATAAPEHPIINTMALWDIEVVPVAADRPTVHDPVRQLVHRHTRPPRVNEVHRALRYVVAEADGSIDDDMGWTTLEIGTNKLMEVRHVLQDAMHHQEDNITICIRGGRYGRITPLLTDLPIGKNPIDVFILNHGTQADNELQFPDLDAHAP